MSYLCDEKGFNKDRVLNNLSRLEKAKDKANQRRMDSFFKPVESTSTPKKGMFHMINRLIERLLIIGCSDKASCHQEAWKEVNYQNLRVCFLFSLFVSISFCSSSTLFCTIIFILYRIIIP